jgi:threonine dehydrogenase-like Zn-dependent dehydrogenase
VADRGRLVILGDTGTPSEQRLTLDVIRRGIHIVGAHDSHDDGRWNLSTITDLFFDLVRRGRFSLAGLNTHAFLPEQCVEAYALVTERRAETMGVRFVWEA